MRLSSFDNRNSYSGSMTSWYLNNIKATFDINLSSKWYRDSHYQGEVVSWPYNLYKVNTLCDHFVFIMGIPLKHLYSIEIRHSSHVISDDMKLYHHCDHGMAGIVISSFDNHFEKQIETFRRRFCDPVIWFWIAIWFFLRQPNNQYDLPFIPNWHSIGENFLLIAINLPK